MADNQYTTPLIINDKGEEKRLERVPLSSSSEEYNEAFIQDLAFRNPSCIPVDEIDRTYENLIPVCRELQTPAGPLDVLYVTPQGRLSIVEAKLWRNPEARRKVVGQILDYAKELAQWSYEDLQREISKTTKRKGNVLYEIANEMSPGIDEATFVDEVTRSLKLGRMLLIILGDGIREGVGAIAQFLDNAGNLEFTLGLVELAIYRLPNNNGKLLQPRVLAKTMIFKRSVVSIKDGNVIIENENEKESSSELTDSEKYYLEFWPEFIRDLELDDPSQPMPKSTSKRGNIFFPMPPSGGQAWITVFFYKPKNQVGVFLTFSKGALGDNVYEHLLNDKESIDEELGVTVNWDSDGEKHSITLKRGFSDIRSNESRAEIKGFLQDSVNLFVNVFRPRLEDITRNM